MLATRLSVPEILMRVTTVSVAVALTFLSVSTSLYAQRADNQVDPRSMALLREGRAERIAGRLDSAIDHLESALVVDPRNRGAYIQLAEVARARDLPGQAIRYYREALQLEPNDREALLGQGEALVFKGAMTQARENLDRLRTLCGMGSCPEGDRLSASIEAGPPADAEEPAPEPAPTPTASPTPDATPTPAPSPTPDEE